MGIVGTNDKTLVTEHENNEAGNGAVVVVTSEGWGGNSEEHESRINDNVRYENDNNDNINDQNDSARRESKQRTHGNSVRWDEFLPFRSLKVLLVENDDSTRRLVGALLRNCGYEVTAVENGKQAWKVLEDLTADVDLVLSELVLPCLSGIGLLCKIKSKNVFKNIPVIMMSSRDSSSVVFECLSKGAVDFLVKPIRKNELKHLWQHVWRKYQISSGASGSESGIRIEKSLKPRTLEDSEDDTESVGFDFRNESDSGTRVGKKIMGKKDLRIGIRGAPNFQLEDGGQNGLTNATAGNKDDGETERGDILKRPRDVKDSRDRNVLRRSDLSAFSRYNSASTANHPAPTANVGSCSPLDSSSDAAKTESPPNSNGSSNSDDMGSTTNDAFAKQVSFAADKPTAKPSLQPNIKGGASPSGSAEDEDRFARREAALKRFRQKRQERSALRKKVRYQSRKKLIGKGMQENNKGKGIIISYDSTPP